MAGWHHWLDGRESGWTPWAGDGQGGLACCNSWGRKESDMTELNNRLLLWSCQPGSLWLYKMDSINKRLRTTSHKDPDWDVSERLFGDVCTGLARSYVWLKSILFSTIKTDLTYDILSLLNKARSMPWAASLDLPLSQVFPRSGKARNCFYI